ncbi:MAG: helix-turn-helix domain-containing protein [Ruminococcaceae bacterium]|nr:helix-turn-helix domain-containing protein [Oscillospiraceae bacterium]
MLVYDKKSYLQGNEFSVQFSDGESKGVLHSHEFLEMCYIVSGTAEHIVNGIKRPLSAGSIIIIDYGVSHIVIDKSKDFYSVNMLFMPEYIDDSLFNCLSFKDVLRNSQINFIYYDNYYHFRDDNGEILPLIEKLVEEYNNERHGNMQYIRCILIQTIILLMRKCESKAMQAKKSDKDFETIVEYLRTHYAEHISLNGLSRMFNHSTAAIYQMFQKNLNIKYADFLTDIRINAACNLLRETSDSIDEIAAAVGYKDTGSFRQVFKNKIGLTPKAYSKKFSGL